ncbi:MAG TPA: hypothetical protein VG692_03870 [Gemmatimonadales bacterium]|nr:hypothetical protein [Gemmatimonadales bacterium]
MRVVASHLPFHRLPWLVAASLLMAGGLLLVARGVAVPGWILLVTGGGLMVLTAGPAYQSRERIVLDDNGLTDLATKLGPIPWADIVRAEVMLVGKTPLVSVEVVNPAEWEARAPDSLRKLRLLAPEMKLPPVLLFAPRLTLTPEEIVRQINSRAQGTPQA